MTNSLILFSCVLSCIFNVCIAIAVLPSCPYGWTLLSKATCVKFFEGPRNYDQAQAYCAQQPQGAGCLVTLETTNKINNFAAVFATIGKNGQRFWIAGRQETAYNPFVWDGLFTGEFEDTNWNVNEPNNFNNEERCVEHLANGKWNDQSCNDRLNFVCEREPIH